MLGWHLDIIPHKCKRRADDQRSNADGNPTQLGIGDAIYLDPGSKAALDSSVPVGATVVLPVVTQSSTKSYVSIVAFAAFAIDASVGGSGKYIMGHFVTGNKVPATVSGVGPYYGVYSSPKLAS